MEKIETDLRRAEFFEGLSDEELSEFAAGAEEREFAYGEELIREGREPGCMYVVTSRPSVLCGGCRNVCPRRVARRPESRYSH